MHELPPDMKAGPSRWRAAPLSDAPVATAKRPFYKRKRYIVPALVLLLAMCGQDEDTVVTDRAPAEQFAAVEPSATPTFDRAQWLAANAATTKDNERAAATRQAAEKAAAEAKARAEAAAKAKAEAEAAARAQAARVAAEQAAAAEAARVAAERAAAEAARREAERQAAEVQVPSNVYYANCDAVRAAGAAPIRVGDPGYSRKLDRDGDGQGCGAD